MVTPISAFKGSVSPELRLFPALAAVLRLAGTRRPERPARSDERHMNTGFRLGSGGAR
jgi:hypothetical protein